MEKNLVSERKKLISASKMGKKNSYQIKLTCISHGPVNIDELDQLEQMDTVTILPGAYALK